MARGVIVHEAHDAGYIRRWRQYMTTRGLGDSRGLQLDRAGGIQYEQHALPGSVREFGVLG